MKKIIRPLIRLFGRRNTALCNPQLAAEALLRTLPQSSGRLLVAGSAYGDNRYRGNVVADVEAFLPWIDHHARAVVSSSSPEQTARLVFPEWLRNADLSNRSLTHLEAAFRNAIDAWVPDLIGKNIAVVHCLECETEWRQINNEKRNQVRAANWSWWTSRWYCPEGHLLYEENHEMHLHIKR